MFKGKVWIINNPYVEMGDVVLFNKYREDLNYEGAQWHFVYESDLMPIVSNKRKCDNRERMSAGTKKQYRTRQINESRDK